MAGRLQGKTALITAAGQGIGYATALAMAREGAQVFATDVDPKLLDHYAGVPNVVASTLDVLDDAAVAATIDALAAAVDPVQLRRLRPSRQRARLHAQGLGLQLQPQRARHVHDDQGALPRMLDNGGGSIINMASVAGSIKGIPNRFAYGASKAAVIGLTKAVAADFVTRNIRCNAIAPGTVDTPSLHDRINAFADPVEARKAFIARQPMGRLAKPEEIAPVVVFLASDESAFATGNVYSVDGGMTI